MLIRVVSKSFVAGLELDENYKVLNCAPILRRKIPMIIKLLSVSTVNHKGYEFKEIKGQKADGSEYTKRIILGQKGKKVNADSAELVNKLNEFGNGEYIELSYDNSKFRNINEIKSAEGFPEVNTNNDTQKGNVKRADGTSRGEDHNRSAAIYLARETMKDVFHAKTLAAMDEDEYLNKLMKIASKIKNYISSGTILNFVKQDGNDVLDPPDLDDDSPFND